jgi:hypothetical protein
MYNKQLQCKEKEELREKEMAVILVPFAPP